jgi:gas vesicle protein
MKGIIMRNYFTGREYTKEAVPNFLDCLKEEVINKAAGSYPDDAEFAKMAFLLLKGNKESLATVAEYIQEQHEAHKKAVQDHQEFVQKVANFMYWAKNWLVHKYTLTKEEQDRIKALEEKEKKEVKA